MTGTSALCPALLDPGSTLGGLQGPRCLQSVWHEWLVFMTVHWSKELVSECSSCILGSLGLGLAPGISSKCRFLLSRSGVEPRVLP